jgi:hypothetical protein
MIQDVAELNRVLLAVSELTEEGGYAELQGVIRQCESVVIESRFPDHELSIKFAETIGFLRKNKNKLWITTEGSSFLILNPKKLYTLSDDQKRLLLRGCYLDGAYRLETLKLLKGFTPVFGDRTFRWSEFDDPPLQSEDWLIEHLVQLNLIIRKDAVLEINSEYIDAVATFISEGKGWTAEALEEYLKERREI